ncbi:hypothetical protein BBJ41_00650 [Burkholderia stabilis]|uniref:hypothetical protein n=1 Tax=Burkholderia cepacia complex TaxID=87882 RepID=UPI0008515954|nr:MULTISPECIES: hypothetical protein [Burkholderia cepacia complex]AOR66175.1 hypothetical protein BBJ41_00650 [Burkholderia stabilis]MBR8042174.1 hypothetical protein [Burkholderia cenocepacia]HDR9492019.1 hypothetical protein [Burkholderia stabilis]HDR9523947.1 hypothetical protein [Burkholderia stabilis]HDR9530746.1 hypothetical protein [Burkholderia stabilis]
MSTITIDLLDQPDVEVAIRRHNTIAKLDDEVSVNKEIAALFLCCSERTLDRMRTEGNGPEYTQDMPRAEVFGAKPNGRRPGITYLMKDLRQWRDSHKVRNPREAIARDRRALSFTTLADLLDDQPWFTKVGSGDLVGHALTGPIEVFEERLVDPEIEVTWLPMPEAMDRPWRNLRERTPFHDAYIGVLGEAMRLSQVRQDDAVLRSEFDALDDERGEPLPPGPGRKTF